MSSRQPKSLGYDQPGTDLPERQTLQTFRSAPEWPGTARTYLELCQKLICTNTIQDVLHAALEIIVPTDVNSVTLLLVSGQLEERYLEVAAAWDRSDQPLLAVGSRFSVEELLFQQLSTTGQCLVLNDLATDARISEYLRCVLLDAETVALVALPLFSEQAFFGTLLIDRTEQKPFSRTEWRLYAATTYIIQGTIEKLWLLHETKQTLSNTAALYEISQRLLACQDLGEILQNVLDSDLFGARGGSIALLEPAGSALNPKNKELVFWAAAGAGAEHILGMRMPVSKGVVGWVVREKQSAMVPDAYADERFYSQIDRNIQFRTQSILCAPLRVEDYVIGAIELVDVRPEYLSEEGVRLLGQVADQAALLIQNQRLLDETQRQAHELSLLLEISQDLTSTMKREETLQLISSRVLHLVKADGCHVFLLQRGPGGQEQLIPVISSHRDARQVLTTPLQLGQGITGRVAQSGTAAIVNRGDLDPRGFTIPGTADDPESLIAAPLISEGRTIGVMTVSRLGETEFVESDLRLVTAMANQAAAVLEKARLFDESQQRSQELAALNAVVSTASQSLSLEEILDATLERVMEVLPGNAGIICLNDATTERLHFATERNLPEPLAMHFEQFGMQSSPCQTTLQKGLAHIVPDLHAQTEQAGLDQGHDEAGVDSAALLKVGLRSYLGAPLIAQGRTMGTIGIYSSAPHVFAETDAKLLTAIGQQVGIAVRNAQLYEQTEHALEESTKLYRASQAIANTLELEDVLQITVDRLTEYLGVDQGRVVLFDTPGGMGRVAAEYEPTAQSSQTFGVATEDNLWYKIVRDRGEALWIEDVYTDSLADDLAPLIDRGTHSLLLIPLVVQGRLIGVVSLTTRVARVFTESQVSFCRTLADRAALAVENRRLFSQTFYTLQETTLLYQASRGLTQAQNLEDILNAITNNLPVKQIDQCWITLIDPHTEPGGRRIEIQAVWDHQGDQSLLHRRFTPRELPLLFQTSGAETWVITDLQTDTRFDAQTISTLGALGIKSALIVPLTTSEGPLGWLILLTQHRTHVFDPEQIRPYQTLADQAAVTIRNQQLLRQIQESLAEVETVHRQYLRSHWVSFLQSDTGRVTGVVFDQGKVVPTAHLPHPLLEAAVTRGGPVVQPVPEQPPSKTEPDKRAEPTQAAKMGATAPATSPERDAGDRDRYASGTTLVMPLTVRGQVIGALGVEDPEQAHNWTPEELTMVQEIADRVAQAVENARLLEETQVSLAETEQLYKATGRLADATSADSVLAVLADEAQAALGPDYNGIILRSGPNPAGQIDWLETSVRWEENKMGSRARTRGYALAKRFMLSQHPRLIHLIRQRRAMILKDRNTPSQPSTMLSIPLVAGNSWLGVINITSRNRGAPDTRLMRFLQNLADRAAIALESVRLYDETQRRAIQLEAAAKVSRAATSILEQDKLLSSVVKLIRDHFNYHQARIFLLDATERLAVLEASTDGPADLGLVGAVSDQGRAEATGRQSHSGGVPASAPFKRGYALAVGGDSLVGYVTSTGEPKIVPGSYPDSADAPQHDPMVTCSELAIPIKIAGRVIGAIDVQSAESDAFGPDDLAVLSTLADQLATAIENARLYQNQLETAEKLREVDRLKTQFLANMSHELRTPLNSIIGFSRVMLKEIDGPVTELQKQDLDAIYNSGQLLLKLISDVLDISKINAGKMELSFAETDLKEIIEGVMTTTGALLKDKPEIEFRQSVPEDLPHIIADATRLRQVLLNLLSNAVKFTKEGYVELRASQAGDMIKIEVSDTGIGVPDDKFDLIFQEFEQVDGSTTRAAGGTGLGLPISRHFVEMHGGRIWVESTANVGSTFCVELSINGPQGKRAGTAPETGSSAPRQRLILVIDDDPDQIRLYKRYLEKQDYQVVGLLESEQALQTARELQPFAILLDLVMPHKDGWAVLHELKANPATREIPIIMSSIVSAAGRSVSMGATDFLAKPVTEERLLATLKRLDDNNDLQNGE